MSPAKSNLEETISTLDYAFRAKNIRNKPQTNQLISKYTLLREFTAEIEKLKSDLVATRQRNGVYLTNDNYEEMTEQSESRRILNDEQKAKIETMETNLRNKVQDLFSLTNAFTNLKKDNEAVRMLLDDTKGVLEKTETVLANTRLNLAQETMLRKAHQNTEKELSTIGDVLITTLGKTVSDVGGLRSKIQRKSELESANRTSWESSQAQVSAITHIVESRVHEFQTQQEQLIQNLSTKMQGYVQREIDTILKEQDLLEEKLEDFQTSEKMAYDQSVVAKEDMNKVLEEIKILREEVKQKVGEGLNGLSAAAGRISAEVISELEGFNTQVGNHLPFYNNSHLTYSLALHILQLSRSRLQRHLRGAGRTPEYTESRSGRSEETTVSSKQRGNASEQDSIITTGSLPRRGTQTSISRPSKLTLPNHIPHQRVWKSSGHPPYYQDRRDSTNHHLIHVTIRSCKRQVRRRYGYLEPKGRISGK